MKAQVLVLQEGAVKSLVTQLGKSKSKSKSKS